MKSAIDFCPALTVSTDSSDDFMPCPRFGLTVYSPGSSISRYVRTSSVFVLDTSLSTVMGNNCQIGIWGILFRIRDIPRDGTVIGITVESVNINIKPDGDLTSLAVKII